MINKVSRYIKTHKLIEDGDRVLIGVSGGADSVCLLHILTTLYRDADVGIFVVHVHHGIRDEEANEDEAFVKDLCGRLGVEYSAYHFDVKDIADKEGLSEEEAGRKVRYEAFVDASIRNRCNKVAIAHNKNDNAETILFNLFRGSGIKGLTGMDSIHTMNTDTGSITVIRPFMQVTREEIEAYLSEIKLQYQDDSTNFGNAYSRNKIRNVVLSYVKEQINTNVIEHINNAAKHLAEVNNFIEECIGKRYAIIVREEQGSYEYLVCDMDREDIVIQKGIVRRILGNLAGKLKDIEANHVDAVLALGRKQVGKRINLPYGIVAVKKYDIVRIYIGKDNINVNHKPIGEKDIIIPGRTHMEESGIYIDSEILNYKNNESFPKNSCMKWFDYDKIENTLKLRTRRPGDFIQIDSHGGRKKLKDYFIDLKIPVEERDRLLLVADGKHIVWILGYGNRISEKYKIRDTTKKILSMILINAKEK
ncbi:MAG: tRNA lysidine(34) synthetase TilS [Clostridiales bacterium]|jgi:tRNA(Ile)-lysidine synthase|nr:tRNA lysidine(34) synthetase TilS [Clostridiales bacterium]